MADEAPGFSPSQFKANAGAPAPAAAPAAAAAPPPKREMVVNNDDSASAPPVSADIEANARTRDASVDGEHEPDALDALADDADDDAPPDPLAEELHGMKAAEIIAAIKDGTIPEALFDALEVELGEGDDKQRVKLRDALDASSQERMQLRDYSRARNQLHQATQAENARQGNFSALIERVIANPATSFEDLRAYGMPEEVLEQACLAYAQERIAYREMSPQMRQIIDRDRETRRNQAKLEAELRELKQDKQKSTTTQREAAQQAALDQHFEAAFKRHSLVPSSAVARADFGAHALALQRAAGNVPLNREIIYKAAQAAKQDDDARAKQRREASGAAPAKPRVGTPLSPSRSAAPMAIKPAARRPEGFTPSQFAANVGKRA